MVGVRTALQAVQKRALENAHGLKLIFIAPQVSGRTPGVGALIEIYWYEDGSSYSYCAYENCAYTVEAEQLSAEEIEEIYTNWIY